MREVFILFFAPHGHSVELIDEVNTNSDYAKYRADMQELSEQADQLAELQEWPLSDDTHMGFPVDTGKPAFLYHERFFENAAAWMAKANPV